MRKYFFALNYDYDFVKFTKLHKKINKHHVYHNKYQI